MNRHIHINQDIENDFKLLKEEAKKRNRSVNFMVNLAIKKFIKNNVKEGGKNS
jgi:hypothetical protein